MPKKKQYTFIDLFAGCGGLSLGMEQAGFTSIFFNEIVPAFASTYMVNRNIKDSNCYVGDINELNEHIDEYLHIWNRYEDGVDLVCGGPPCQGFSMANRRLHGADKPHTLPRLPGNPPYRLLPEQQPPRMDPTAPPLQRPPAEQSQHPSGSNQPD